MANQVSFISPLVPVFSYFQFTLDDKAAKEKIAEVLQMEGGMQALLTELLVAPSSAPAFGYIATFIKDFGGLFFYFFIFSIFSKLIYLVM